MAKANKDALNDLHGMLAEHLTAILKSGDPEAISPAFLNQVRQFLRDNRIEGDVTRNPALRNLVESLPFPSADGEEELPDFGEVRH